MFYQIRHVTKFQYDEAVSETVMEVRKHPRSDAMQRCLSHELTTTPRARIFSYRDYLGNVVHHFNVPGRYSRLMLVAESLVEVDPSPEVPQFTPDAWAELDGMVARGDYWEMLRPSHFARPSQALEEFRSGHAIERNSDPLETILAVRNTLYEVFDYEPRSTAVDSPIEVALESRKGVCQDFAHIMIALTRELGIPCRYVSGYLFHNRTADRSAEGATHAWVEALLPR